MEIFKAEIPCTGKNVNALEITVDYKKGGINYFTYEEEPRGYQLVIVPVEKKTENGLTCVSFGLGIGAQGRRTMVKEVSRRSAKSDAEAIVLAAKKLAHLIDVVVGNNQEFNLEVDNHDVNMLIEKMV